MKGRHDHCYVPDRAEVLVVMAHPDDAEFGCGGTIATLAAQGKCVWYVLVTSGDEGTEDRDMPPHGSPPAARSSSATRRGPWAQQDARSSPIRTASLRTPLRGKLVGVIRRLKPDIVITWDGYRHS